MPSARGNAGLLDFIIIVYHLVKILNVHYMVIDIPIEDSSIFSNEFKIASVERLTLNSNKNLMNDATLDFEEGVNIFECLQEGWITIGGDELQDFSL